MIALRRLAASGPVVLIAAAVIGAGLACFTPRPRPRFGSLLPEARSFAIVDPTVRVQLDNGLVAALAPDPRTNLAAVAAVARADLAHARMVVEVAGPAKIVAATYAVVGNDPE